MVIASPRDALDGVEHGKVLVHALGLGHSVAVACGRPRPPSVAE